MEIQIGNKTLELTLLEKEGNRLTVDVDGTVYTVDAAMLPGGTCSLIHNGNSYNASLVRGEGGKHYRVSLNYSTYEVDILDPQAKYMKMRRSSAVPGQQADTLCAPMPCKIVKVFVREGQTLQEGDTVLTLEAMKMQSACKVTAPCRVTKIHVAEGDSASANQLLVSLDLNPETENNNE